MRREKVESMSVGIADGARALRWGRALNGEVSLGERIFLSSESESNWLRWREVIEVGMLREGSEATIFSVR